MKILINTLAMAALVLLVTTQAFAAQDGTLGATSEGTSTLTLSVSDMVKISGIADLSAALTGGAATAVSADDAVCVYNNDLDAPGMYRIKAYGQYNSTGGAGTDFYVRSTAGTNTYTIPYHVYWNTATGSSTANELLANTAETDQANANTTSESCGGGNNANFMAVFLRSDILAKPSGTYGGQLYLVVEPN